MSASPWRLPVLGVVIALLLMAAHQPAAITIDYPEDGSIFPPEITAPTFLWRDAAASARLWRIDVTFGDGVAGIRATIAGERMRIGEIDPRCVSDTNEPPEADAAAGGGAYLEAGRRDLGGHQAALGRHGRPP